MTPARKLGIGAVGIACLALVILPGMLLSAEVALVVYTAILVAMTMVLVVIAVVQRVRRGGGD